MLRQFRTFLLLALIGLLTLAAWISRHRSDALTTQGREQETSVKITRIEQDSSPLAVAASSAPSEVGEVAVIDHETSAALAESLWLAQRVEQQRINLDPLTVQAIAATIADFQQVRRDYEAQICQITPVDGRRVAIAVPAYPEVGDAMRNEFYAELEQRAGVDVARKVLNELDSVIEQELGEFGQVAQRLEVFRNPADPIGSYSALLQTEALGLTRSLPSRQQLAYFGGDIIDSNCLTAFLPRIRERLAL